MAVRSLAYLKARFNAKSEPTKKDFIDLIDSLAALAPGSITTDAFADEAVTPPKLFPGDPLDVMTTNPAGDAAWVPLGMQHLAASYILVDQADAGANILHIVPENQPADVTTVNLSYFVKAGQDITGASSLQIGAATPLPIRIAGVATEADDILDEEVYIFFCDGTYAHMLKASTAAIEAEIADIQAQLAGGVVLSRASVTVALPTVNGTEVSLTHGFASKPDLYQVFFVAKTNNNDYLIGERVSFLDAVIVYANGAYSAPLRNAFSIAVTDTVIKIQGQWASYPLRIIQYDAAVAQFVVDTADWEILIVAYGPV